MSSRDISNERVKGRADEQSSRPLLTNNDNVTANRPYRNVCNHAVQFVPIAVSATQQINNEGRTICKVIGCNKVDYAQTNGYCKQHHAMFCPAPIYNPTHVMNRGGNYGSDWTCICGEKVSAKKKRCWNCSKWRGGSKSAANAFSQPNAVTAAASIPIPRLPPISGLPPLPAMYHVSDSDVRAAVGERKRNRPDIDSVVHETDADITKLKIPKKCAERWSNLFIVRDQRKRSRFSRYKTSPKDPFDCSDLIIPPSTEILEQEAYKAIQRWEDLDSRIVMNEENDLDEVSTSADNSLIIDGTMAGDGRKQRLLPPHFDYKCASMPSDGINHDQQQQLYYRPRVISLLDPNETLDYESELWHIFKSMPTVTEVERQHGIAGALQCNGSSHGLHHTLQVKHDVKKFALKHTRMDAHALGRLRVRDRHSIPLSLTPQPKNESICLGESLDIDTAIRFEVLRYSENLKRGASRDSNRLEVELSGSQHTLFDLHQVLAENAALTGNQSISCTSNSVPAAIFFIENSFYTYGVNGDHAGRAILRWLDENASDVPEGARRKHLCISSKNTCTLMSEIDLNSLPLRLGIRYVYILIDEPHSRYNKISLQNEYALFVTDIQSRSGALSSAPIIHDKWTPLKSIPICSACNSSVATVVTLNDELTSTISSSTPMCGQCFRDLHYQSGSEGEHVELRSKSAHISFKSLSMESFDKLVSKNAMDKIPGGAIF